MRVKGLPQDPGPAAWNAILPVQSGRPVLSDNITVDFLVIGAGFAGLTAAKRLSELAKGSSVAVLEARSVAEGPAGRNSGFMIDVPHDLSSDDYAGNAANDHREISLNRAAISYALDAKCEFGMSDEAIAVRGKVNGAITSRGMKHNDEYAKHLDSMNEPYERLSANEMKLMTGSESYVDGLYTPGTAMLQPALYIRSLAMGVESMGVSIYEQSPVVALKKAGSDWFAQTPKGSIRARKIILGVNGHLESFGYYHRHLMHIFTYGSMTRRLTSAEITALGGTDNWAITPADPLGTTARRISGIGGDRLIIRNRATFNPSLQVNSGTLVGIARTHERSFADRFPQLAGVEMDYCWGGHLCLSRNNVAVFGEIEQGVYSACCQNGLGTAKGTISGKLAAELACEVSSDLLDQQMSYDPPSRLPPAPIAKLGATGVLRWGEFRAGKEL